MKNTNRFFLLPALLIVFFTSCKKNDVPDDPSDCINTTNWIKDGHQMAYVNKSPFYQADSLFVSFKEVGDGIFESTSVFDDGLLIPAAKVYLQPCRKWVYQASGSAMDDKQPVYLLEGVVGDTWQSTTTSFAGNQVVTQFSIVAKDISVTVPAGTFNCLQIQGISVVSGQTIETNHFIHSEKGIAKVTGTTVSYELGRANF